MTHQERARELYATIRGRLIYPSNAEDEKAAAIELIADALEQAAQTATAGLCAELEHYRGLAERMGAEIALSERDEALRQLQSSQTTLAELQAAQPVWTTERPALVGWYWWRQPGVTNSGLYIVTSLMLFKGFLVDASTMDAPEDGEWAKIPLPREA